MQGGFFLKHTKAPLYPDKNAKLIQTLPQKVLPLKGAAADYEPILSAMGPAKVVLIGEATHGTHEFYKIRADITKKLITDKGITMVAVEGDWPDVYRINRYVCGKSKDSNAKEALGDFQRFPKWMWRNTVVEDFVEWLRKYNERFGDKTNDKVRFYGLDLYSMFRSADLVIEYLEKTDPKAAELAKQRYGTLNRYRNKEFKYAEDVMLGLTPSREKEVVSILVQMLQKEKEYLEKHGFVDGDELFFAQQNAKLVKDAEEYYRNAYARGPTTWNLRDKHMFETLKELLDFHQKRTNRESKAVVRAHNSHVGDSRATEYARESGEWNIGQLVRENLGLDKSYNVGFTTYTGTVTAASSWGGDAIKFKLNPAFEDSYEAVFHQGNPSNWLSILRANANPGLIAEDLVKLLAPTRTERMVGVQYVKRSERQSHYVPATLPQQFDALIHLDVTSALQPLDGHIKEEQ